MSIRRVDDCLVMPRPASILVTGYRAALIRQHETEEDVFRRDVMPTHLVR